MGIFRWVLLLKQGVFYDIEVVIAGFGLIAFFTGLQLVFCRGRESIAEWLFI